MKYVKKQIFSCRTPLAFYVGFHNCHHGLPDFCKCADLPPEPWSSGEYEFYALFIHSFSRTATPLTNWLYTLPSILEEVAFRGVILAMFLRFYNQPKAILFSALGFGVIHLGNMLSGSDPVWIMGQAVWAAILGLFYGYVTLKTNSLLPAMIVHYLGNLFVSELNAYIQTYATIPEQVLYGVVFTLGAIPTFLLIL